MNERGSPLVGERGQPPSAPTLVGFRIWGLGRFQNPGMSFGESQGALK